MKFTDCIIVVTRKPRELAKNKKKDYEFIAFFFQFMVLTVRCGTGIPRN